MTTILLRKKSLWVAAGTLLLLAWLTITDHPTIWPVRNTLQYRLMAWWWEQAGPPTPQPPGSLAGVVSDPEGRPVAEAWVLAARWDGTTYNDQTDDQGRYTIEGMPAGRYQPVAGRYGFDSLSFGGLRRLYLRPGEITRADVILRPERPPVVSPGQNLVLGQPITLTCQVPFQASAIRRQVTFDNGGRPNQLTFFYTPVATSTAPLPILLAVYPGPADGWECASIPLAAAGYAVVGIGPAYSFDPERDIDELERLAGFIRTGQLPGSDGSRLAVLGGSYSGLHVQRLLQRDQNFRAAVLLGAPTDLFELRRRLEAGSFSPPFGLDRAFIALGFPDREPLRYWRYSGAYHVRPDLPPLAVLHSRSDEIVPYEQSELLAAHLDAIGAKHETHFFDGASHYLLSEADNDGSLLVYELVLNFLERTMP